MQEGLQRGDLSAESSTQSNKGLTVRAEMENREEWVRGMLRKRDRQGWGQMRSGASAQMKKQQAEIPKS